MNTVERIADIPAETRVSRVPADFARHIKARNRRLRLRRFIRGATGIVLILVAWQVASQVLDLELLLPEPLTVLRNVVSTLTVSDPH